MPEFDPVIEAYDEGYKEGVADERERCARIIKDRIDKLEWGHSCAEFIDEALRECEAAIRKGE